MSLRRTLSLATVALAAAGTFASAPAANAYSSCNDLSPVYDGCVYVLENGCAIREVGTLLGGPFLISCLP